MADERRSLIGAHGPRKLDLRARLLLLLPIIFGVFLSTATSDPQQDDQGRNEAPTTAVERDGCVTSECHTDIKDQAFLHGPLYIDACDACHVLTDAKEHAYSDTRSREALCTFCHEFEYPQLGSSHEPATTGECLACHDPHGGAQRGLLREVAYEDMCTACHDNTRGDVRVAHHPELTGACGACHDPHASSNQKLLTVSGRELCLGCHVVVGLQLDLLHVTHPPAEGDCLICHDPHATDVPGMLVKDPQRLCTGCHAEVRHVIEGASSQHAAVTDERACLNCHDPHASDHARLLKQETMPLCFECHDRTQKVPGGGVVADIKRQIDRGISAHGPVADGDCVACHQIHGGDYDRLLKRENPTGAYGVFSPAAYSLCFGCHDRSLVAHERATVVTRFRNGDQNLHYTHVASQEKGRTCHVCHDPHAGANAHQLRNSVPFGPSGWELPIAWSATENGGSCSAACHETLAYDREQPVEYPEHSPGLERSWPRIVDDEGERKEDKKPR